jgi:hypothetical protein
MKIDLTQRRKDAKSRLEMVLVGGGSLPELRRLLNALHDTSHVRVIVIEDDPAPPPTYFPPEVFEALCDSTYSRGGIRRVVQCYWSPWEICPHALKPRDLLTVASRAARYVVRQVRRPLLQFCWSHRRWGSITSKTHQRRA